MKDINRVVLRGELIRDAYFTNTPRGTAVTSFTLAFTNVPAQPGGPRNKKGLIDVIYCSNESSPWAQLLKKASTVVVEGRLQQRSWQTPEGIQKQKMEIVADKLSCYDLSSEQTEDDGD